MATETDDPQRLSLGRCTCSGGPHGEDAAWMSLEQGARAFQRAAKANSGDTFERYLTCLEAAVLGGLVAWNLTDDKGEPLPLREAVDDYSKGRLLAEWFVEQVFNLVDEPLWRVGGVTLGEGDRGDGGEPN